MRHDIINQLTIAMLHDISCTNQHALFTFYFSNHNSVFFMVSVSSTQCCKLYFSKNPEIKITVTVHRRSITTSCIHVSNISHSLRDWRPFVPDVRLMNSSKLTSGFDFESCGHLCIALLHLTTKFINILIIAVWKLWPLQLLMDYMQFFLFSKWRRWHISQSVAPAQWTACDWYYLVLCRGVGCRCALVVSLMWDSYKNISVAWNTRTVLHNWHVCCRPTLCWLAVGLAWRLFTWQWLWSCCLGAQLQ